MRGATRCSRSSDAHLAEDGVLAIEVRLFRVGDKELGLVRVWASVRHSHDPPVVELSKICIRKPRVYTLVLMHLRQTNLVMDVNLVEVNAKRFHHLNQELNIH